MQLCRGAVIRPHAQALLIFLTAVLAAGASGCGILFGNIKPVDEKAQNYGVMDLSKENPEWSRLDSKGKDAEASAEGISDVAYQSKKTASIISLNSACHGHSKIDKETDDPPKAEAEAAADENSQLRTFTNQLLLGITELTLRNEKPLHLRDLAALQTTVRGKLNSEPVMLRTVVLRRDPCVYDLMFVTRPDRFAENEQDFSRFVSSLSLQ